MNSSDHEVDMDSSGRSIWLVKVPAFLKEHWESAPPGTDVGGVRVEQHGDTPATVTMHLPAETPLPKEYTLKFTGDPKGNVMAFSEDDYRRRIEGTVQYECTAMPILDDDYRRMMRERTQARSSSPPKKWKGKEPLLPSARAFQPLPRVPKRQRNERNDRMERDDLLQVVFRAFERQTHWSLKAMVQLTQQPTLYMKEILRELCDYHPRGEWRSTYALKAEYAATPPAAPST